MSGQQGFSCAVDIVLCIDLTGSMAPAIDMVKANALKLHGDIRESLAKKDRDVTQLRIKVIGFRDVEFDDEPFVLSDWFVLPEAATSFENFVNRLVPDGGGDEPESALDALSLAIQSDWTRECDRQRHIVVLWTDATPKPPSGGTIGSVPTVLTPFIASSFEELSDTWNDPQGGGTLKPNAKRLLLFAPDCEAWDNIHANWEEALHFPSRAGEGLSDTNYNVIIDTLANSIS